MVHLPSEMELQTKNPLWHFTCYCGIFALFAVVLGEIECFQGMGHQSIQGKREAVADYGFEEPLKGLELLRQSCRKTSLPSI